VSDSLILAGAIPAALLALIADFLLGRLERRLRFG
jgi:ABC-type proline/glycine betaine transport system permease subunit